MAEVTPIRTAAETALVDLFPAVKASLPGDARIAGEREKAFSQFVKAGLPHRRVEAWKYTDLRALLREAAPLAPAPDAALLREVQDQRDLLAGSGAAEILIVDGHLAGGLDRLPAGVEAVGLAEALTSGHPLLARMGEGFGVDDPILALNTAFATDGVVLKVAAGKQVHTPIALRFVRTGATPFASFARVLVVVEDGASLSLVESHELPDGVAHQANTAVEILAGEETRVDHVRLTLRGSGAVDLSSFGVRLGRQAQFNSFALALGASLSRHQVFATFAGEHAKANVSGAALLHGRQHADTTLFIDHAQPHGESRELFKNVLDGDATGVFQGKIVVQQAAQKTDGRMMSQAVLLSDGATMNNKPELEIFADDVQCAHGATCGELDDDLLFYLRARGLPKPEAEALMLQAFVGEAIATVQNEAVRDVLEDAVAAWLRARM
jgi:Fe-S cluster assembly protein SufD